MLFRSRSHYGFLELENEEKAFQAKIMESLATARQDSEEGEGQERRAEGGEEEEGEAAAGDEEGGVAVPMRRRGSITTLADREEMAGRIWRETTQLRQERSRAVADSNFGGPCFDLPYNNR